jgi:hypothetical protein
MSIIVFFSLSISTGPMGLFCPFKCVIFLAEERTQPDFNLFEHDLRALVRSPTFDSINSLPINHTFTKVRYSPLVKHSRDVGTVKPLHLTDLVRNRKTGTYAECTHREFQKI